MENNIRPPGYDSQFAEELKDIFLKFKEELRKHVLEHISAKLIVARNSYTQANKADMDLIKSVAVKSAKRRTKISEAAILAALENLFLLSDMTEAENADSSSANTVPASGAQQHHRASTTANAESSQTTMELTNMGQERTPTPGPSQQQGATNGPQGDQGFQQPRKKAKGPPGSPQIPITSHNPFTPLSPHLTEEEILEELEITMVEPPPSASKKRKLNTSLSNERQHSKTFIHSSLLREESGSDANASTPPTAAVQRKTPTRGIAAEPIESAPTTITVTATVHASADGQQAAAAPTAATAKTLPRVTVIPARNNGRRNSLDNTGIDILVQPTGNKGRHRTLSSSPKITGGHEPGPP